MIKNTSVTIQQEKVQHLCIISQKNSVEKKSSTKQQISARRSRAKEAWLSGLKEPGFNLFLIFFFFFFFLHQVGTVTLEYMLLVAYAFLDNETSMRWTFFFLFLDLSPLQHKRCLVQNSIASALLMGLTISFFSYVYIYANVQCILSEEEFW